MLIRIVKLHFHEDNIETFLFDFELIKHKIRGFKGNKLVELHQDFNNPNIFFTYTYWESEMDLENYRQSDLFKEIWSKTKLLFNAKAEAWSVKNLVSLP